jgi:RNA polymerase sigma factor (sigma-70 family)
MEAGAVPRVAPPMAPALTPRLLRLASDARLVGLVRDGRRGAFEALYDRHHKGILAFCRHMLGDADEAEDAVQHTFMAAYSDLTRSEKPIHLKAWLFTIARNRCFSILRARREQPSAEIAESVGEGLASQVQRRQDLRDLVHDMHELPEEQRAAILLAELDALSHAEIAAVLGVPREKVKALVFQARESLLASRAARDTACAEIREQIACGRGASLRRANLRRHLRECDGCREFRAQVDRQRRQFALFLPVGPALALKEAVLGSTLASGAAGGSGVGAAGGAAALGGGLISSAIKSGIAKGLIGAALTGVGTAGTLVASGTGIHIHALLNIVTHTLAGRPARATAIARVRGHAVPARAPAWRLSGASTTSTAVTAGEVRVPLRSGGHARSGAAVSHARLAGQTTGRRRLAKGLHAAMPAGPPTSSAAAAPVGAASALPGTPPAAPAAPATTPVATHGPDAPASASSTPVAGSHGRPTFATIATADGSRAGGRHGVPANGRPAAHLSKGAPHMKAHPGRGHSGHDGPSPAGPNASSSRPAQPRGTGSGEAERPGAGKPGGPGAGHQGGAGSGAGPGAHLHGTAGPPPVAHGGHGKGGRGAA